MCVCCVCVCVCIVCVLCVCVRVCVCVYKLLFHTDKPPSPPQNLSYQIISTSCHSSRVQFNWLPPENDDGQGNIDINHYYISIQNTTLASYVQYDTPDEKVWIDVVHDVLYDFNVTASNCDGQFRSKAANLRIKIGEFLIYFNSHYLYSFVFE